jgi:hemerythrin superfamily protein
MSIQLEDNKRMAIAVKLADMKALQNLLIANEQALVQACPDRDLSNRFEAFVRDDRKNLDIINTVIIQYGIKAEPSSTMHQEAEAVEKIMQDTNLTLFDKVSKHELLKHTQAMSGVLVHKAAQVVGEDIALAIAPLNIVNFENRAHEEQLKGIMESLSTLELTGKPAAQGLWAGVQDTIAALSGLAGGIIRSDYEMNICELIRLDHTKLNTLFGQIHATEDPQLLEEYFGQIYRDLSTHYEAEEQVLYPAVRNYYDNTQKLYDAQVDTRQLLDQIKAMSCADIGKLKAAIGQLKAAVNAHVEEEESAMFPRIQDGFGDEQQKSLATEFQTAKSQIQDRRVYLPLMNF